MSAVSDSIALVYGAIAILIHLAAFELFASTLILFGIVALRCREGGPTRCGTKARAVSYLTSHIHKQQVIYETRLLFVLLYIH